MAVQVLRRLFTVAEYHKMAEAGILSEDDRVELIEGEIVVMAPIGSRHVVILPAGGRPGDRQRPEPCPAGGALGAAA